MILFNQQLKKIFVNQLEESVYCWIWVMQ